MPIPAIVGGLIATGVGLAAQGAAAGIASGVEGKKAANRLSQQQYIDYAAGGSIKDAARRGNQMQRVAMAGAQKPIASRSQYLPSLGGDFGLISPERLRAIRRASNLNIKANQQALAQGAIGDQAGQKKRSAEAISAAAGIAGTIAQPFTGSIDTGTKEFGKIALGKTLLPAFSGLYGQAATDQSRAGNQGLLGGTGLYGQNPYNLGY
tara:strand:+ start:8910 stop:9533 length:624 start_codon:yes stop_codon:yes gene_type:complete